MNEIFKFMKSTKGLILIIILITTSLIVAIANNKKENPINNKQKLLIIVSELLEKQHYSPQNINDDFSKKIFTKFIEDLDGDKTLFLAEDIEALKKYETKLDDEIHGKAEFEFLNVLNGIYDKRIDQTIITYRQILNVPFDFTIEESFKEEISITTYALNLNEFNDRLRKKIKYMALDRYVDLLEQKEKTVIDSLKNKSNVLLEQEARLKVLKALDKVYTRVKAKLTADERFNSLVNVITNQMDPHSDYFPPVEKRAFDEQMSGRFFGIGAQLQEQDGNIKIVSLMPAYPAQRSGQIAVNDIIIKVAQGNEEPVEIIGYEVTDAVKLIRGKKDTEVKLTLKKVDGTTKVVAINRAEIVQDEVYVRSAVINDENGDKIGYIWLPDFYADFERQDGARCSEDVAKELVKLKAANVKGIVMDLRFNGGGSLFEVVQMVGFFIPQGPVVQVRDKDGKATVLDDKNNGVLYDGPLTVLVNEASASASEIFAAAIQDYGRGIIIGSATFGKGTVQRNIPLSKQPLFYDAPQPQSDLGFVKLTFQKFYRVNGGSTQLRGVTPDVVIPDLYDNLKIREKDIKSSLVWDEIPKAIYQLYKSPTFDFVTIKKANEVINLNGNFQLLKSNTEWLAKRVDEAKPLQLEKYRDYQKRIAATVNQNNSLIKSKKDLDAVVLKDDYDKFYNNADKAKGERYQAWLKAIKADLYIAQSVNITKSMINNSVVTVKELN